MISLATFRPEHFNNNGDQGNIEVLSYLLNQNSVAFEVGNPIEEDSDFVLIGDASFAALKHYETDLVGLIPLLTRRLKAGRATLIIGASYEFFSGRVPGLPQFELAERRSGFVKLKTDSLLPVFGYRNSAQAGEAIFISGAFICTQLFGPALAKNPSLLKLITKDLGLELELSGEILELIGQIRDRTIF
jgi:CobQ-like glutamine amidotransferase family enzyme